MGRRFGTIRGMLLVAGLAGWMACGGGDGGDEGRADATDVPEAGDVATETAADLPGEAAVEVVDDLAAEAVADGAPGETGDDPGEETADLPPLEVPYFPPVPANPVKDELYVQETNHTSNEVDGALKPLVAVLPAIEGVGVAGHPVQVTPRGVA